MTTTPHITAATIASTVGSMAASVDRSHTRDLPGELSTSVATEGKRAFAAPAARRGSPSAGSEKID
jgi:hypothetical protein